MGTEIDLEYESIGHSKSDAAKAAGTSPLAEKLFCGYYTTDFFHCRSI